MISARLSQTGEAPRLHKPENFLKLAGMSQAKLDQTPSVDPQAAALCNYGFVVLRRADDQFDYFAVEQQRLETDWSAFQLGEMAQKLKRGRQMDHRQAAAPYPGLDVLRLGISGIVQNKLCHFID